MLGEGFDLPELKIAAFHDIRKSLAVTLQLAGRFTRDRPNLGDATFIANIADVQVRDELRKLYTRDPDWNLVLSELSDKMIDEQQSLQEFLRGFTDFASEIPIQTVQPAFSTVVYRTKCANWSPENFINGIPAIKSCARIHGTINHEENTLVVVTARRVPLKWTDIESLFGWDWELYVVIWSCNQNLLFIHSSTNSGEYEALARSVAGDDVILVNGQQVFRPFADVNRLLLQNVGLTEQLGRNVRYTGRMGADVESAITELQKEQARKSVLSGTGYEAGRRVTIAASRKGRIWSHQRGHVDKLVAWCKRIGAKLLDTSIDPDDVLKGTLASETIAKRPKKVPICADWPVEFYNDAEVSWSMIIDGHKRRLSELEISIAGHSVTGPLKFAITSEAERVEFDLELFEENQVPKYRFVVSSGHTPFLRRGRTDSHLTKFFYTNPPIIWFADGSSLEGNRYVELKKTLSPYDATKIDVWDWTGINIQKESQGICKDETSIQARVISELKTRDYDVIIDDDGKGEIADVVAIRLVGDKAAPTEIDVNLYHCKYSHEATPGARVRDLYEVCGQAQKSVSWMYSEERKIDLFTHFLRRNASRIDRNNTSRLEVGDKELLGVIREMSRLSPLKMKIFIVQPGVSKQRASRDQLLLLRVTENYLFETYQLPFGVITSA